MDFLGPLKAGQGNVRYALIIFDGLSRFLEIKLFKKANINNVIIFLNEWENKHGEINKIITDRHSIFTGKKFKQFCNEKMINPIITSSYNHKTNGLVKRSIGNLINRIRRLLFNTNDN